MFTAFAIGATAVSTIAVLVVIGLACSLCEDFRRQSTDDNAREAVHLLLVIGFASPLCGLVVFLWQKALG